MNSKEKEIYMAAFSKSKAKSYDARKAEAEAAVATHKGALKAVGKGMKEGTLAGKAAARKKRMDKEIDGS